jgi:uncharacterized membrane protein
MVSKIIEYYIFMTQIRLSEAFIAAYFLLLLSIVLYFYFGQIDIPSVPSTLIEEVTTKTKTVPSPVPEVIGAPGVVVIVIIFIMFSIWLYSK